MGNNFSNPDEPVKVAEHKDIEDDGQTVLITERIIKIHTTATDKDGNKELEAGKDVTIIDTVTLEGLEVGTKYQLKGWQMLKKENAELLINGKRVESDYTFTADSENMKVEVAFTFDATPIWDCHPTFLSLMNMWRFLKCWGRKKAWDYLAS